MIIVDGVGITSTLVASFFRLYCLILLLLMCEGIQTHLWNKFWFPLRESGKMEKTTCLGAPKDPLIAEQQTNLTPSVNTLVCPNRAAGWGQRSIQDIIPVCFVSYSTAFELGDETVRYKDQSNITHLHNSCIHRWPVSFENQAQG